mgnify:CR=1 FL=1
MVDVTQINDPLSTMGDPSGFPRNLLFELRQVQFLNTPAAVVALHMWEKRWRIIWTDGRQLPKDPDPRWYGYSVGHWEDDTTFVVNSNGTDDRTWLDNAGNPHSDALTVEERWHRVSEKKLELTVTLTDPKIYQRPWVALDKLPMVQYFLGATAYQNKDYPTAQKEFEIVLARVPEAPELLAREVVAFVHRLREADLTKVPGIAETLDWAAALISLGARELDPDLVNETLGVVDADVVVTTTLSSAMQSADRKSVV